MLSLCSLVLVSITFSISYFPCHCATLIKSVNLTTTNSNETGAIISLPAINNDASIDAKKNEWYIDVDSQRGYHLEINLDNTWGFSSNSISYIIFTMYGTEDLNILVSFSVNNNEYITVLLQYDNTLPNSIYPGSSCNISTINELANGNIKSFVEQEYYNGEYSRDNKATGGRQDIPIQPSNIGQHDHDNEMPITITLRNDVINNRLYVVLSSLSWGNWTQQCVYNAFSVNNGLDIYLGLSDVGESMSFQQFGIQYLIVNTTVYHTITDIPTKSPTYKPTKLPTGFGIDTITSQIQTLAPSNIPTSTTKSQSQVYVINTTDTGDVSENILNGMPQYILHTLIGVMIFLLCCGLLLTLVCCSCLNHRHIKKIDSIDLGLSDDSMNKINPDSKPNAKDTPTPTALTPVTTDQVHKMVKIDIQNNGNISNEDVTDNDWVYGEQENKNNIKEIEGAEATIKQLISDNNIPNDAIMTLSKINDDIDQNIKLINISVPDNDNYKIPSIIKKRIYRKRNI